MSEEEPKESKEEPKEELIPEDEIPDPIECETCGEYKTEEEGEIRLYGMLFGSLRGTDDFTKEQLEGALHMMGYISGYMNHIHFETKTVFCRKALVKTLEEIYENLAEHYYHFDKIKEMQDDEDEPLLEEREKETESLISEYNSGGL